MGPTGFIRGFLRVPTVEYFTDDITRLPVSMMWRIVWRTSPL
jgi:hypothetical protein